MKKTAKACPCGAYGVRPHQTDCEWKDMPRSVRYKLRHVAAGKCRDCPRALYRDQRCRRHWKAERERRRQKWAERH